MVLLLVACAAPPAVNGCDVALAQTTETFSSLGTMTSIGDGFVHLRCGESSALEGCQARLTCECDAGR
ncbi:MAG: hypothetical protein GQE15_35860 [Archangiaceae bacterium]|nr:hypothetical protein [Archangiaceae bacterium]